MVACEYDECAEPRAVCKRVAAGRRHDAEVVLMTAREVGADLLMMGGYGHSHRPSPWRTSIRADLRRLLLAVMTWPPVGAYPKMPRGDCGEGSDGRP